MPGGAGMLCQFVPKSCRQKSDKQPSVLAHASTLILNSKGFLLEIQLEISFIPFQQSFDNRIDPID